MNPNNASEATLPAAPTARPDAPRTFKKGGLPLKSAMSWAADKIGVKIEATNNPASNTLQSTAVLERPTETAAPATPPAETAQPPSQLPVPDAFQAPAAPEPPTVETPPSPAEPTIVPEAKQPEPEVEVPSVSSPAPEPERVDVAPPVPAPAEVPSEQVSPVEPVQAEQSYVDKTYGEVKNKYPNLTISNKFYKEKPPIMVGGDTGLGGSNKMDVLNTGEPVSQEMAEKTGQKTQDRAVAFKLREGSQDGKLIFGIDSTNPDRIINFPDINKIPDMPDDQLQKTLAIYKDQTGNLIVMNGHGEATQIQKGMLETGSYVFTIDPKTGLGLELVGYGAGTSGDDDIVALHKVHTDPAPVVAPPAPGWREKIIELIGPVAITTGIAVGAADAAAIPDAPPPQATVQFVEQPPAPVIEVPVQKPVEGPVQQSKAEFHPSLTCPETVEKTVQQGDSLTKLIVDENGIDRYLKKGEDGKFGLDVDELYQDLMCMLVQPQNMAQLEKDDPAAASLVSSMLELQRVTGAQITSEQLYDAFKKELNTPERVSGANNQLVLTFEGSKWAVPSYKAAPPRVHGPVQPVDR